MGVSTPIDSAPVTGETLVTLGAPTVVKSRSPVPPWGFPARSWTPAAMWTWNVVDKGSLDDGVKIILRPCQWNEPDAFGDTESLLGCVVSDCLTEVHVDGVECGDGTGSGRIADVNRIGRWYPVDHDRVVQDSHEHGHGDNGR